MRRGLLHHKGRWGGKWERENALLYEVWWRTPASTDTWETESASMDAPGSALKSAQTWYHNKRWLKMLYQRLTLRLMSPLLSIFFCCSENGKNVYILGTCVWNTSTHHWTYVGVFPLEPWVAAKTEPGQTPGWSSKFHLQNRNTMALYL